MLKQVERLKVRTNNEGQILIEQPDGIDDEQTQLISIWPEQVPLLISWLQDAVAEVNPSSEFSLTREATFQREVR